MQTVVLEQQRCWAFNTALKAFKLRGVLQRSRGAVFQTYRQAVTSNTVVNRVFVLAIGQRQQGVQPLTCCRYHFCTANRIVAACLTCAVFFTDDVSAVECVVQTTPTRIGRIQRIPCIINRHYQLRTGHGCHFGIYTAGFNAKVRWFWYQVTDVL